MKIGDADMNKSSTVLSKFPSVLSIIIVLQVALYLSYFFDIAISRQVIGFIYLTFIPGFIILKLLRQNNLGSVETILFSVGLSVAFVMLTGLLVNEFGLLINVSQPLAPSFLVLAISGFVLFGALVCYFRGSDDFPPVGLTQATVVKPFVLFLLPVLTVVGAYLANVTGNTTILLLVLLTILAVFVLAVFYKRLFTPKLCLILVLVIAVTLLFHQSLISNYVQGNDIKGEYYLASLTQNAGFWNSSASFSESAFNTYYSMLSVTILPTMYSNILNMDITWVFKIVYPLIFALVPLALYLLWREKFGVSVAFLSAFLFVSQITFYTEMLGLARQMIAELFFVLLFLTLFSKRLSPRNAKILFVIFGFGLITSHYSIAIIFAFFILLMWLLGPHTKMQNRHLNLSMVVIFLVLMFSWYILTISSANFIKINGDLIGILSGFSDFLNPASRGTTVMAGLGLLGAPTFLNVVSRIIFYATVFFIIVGFFVLLRQRKKKDFDFEYFIPCLASMLILALCILLPNFANTFNMTRFYHLVLFFLAPLFAVGCLALFRFGSKSFGEIAKRKREIGSLVLMTLLLGSYFLFQTNLVYEVAGSESWSLPLSRYNLGSRLYTDFNYLTVPQVRGGEWLSHNTNASNLAVYADQRASPGLFSYGGIYIGNVIALTNNTSPQRNQFVFLAELNTVYGEIDSGSGLINLTDTIATQHLSQTYDNGLCKIFTETAAAP
jgi:uncharacterized membrane protein